jgi:hypothetical protein
LVKLVVPPALFRVTLPAYAVDANANSNAGNIEILKMVFILPL